MIALPILSFVLFAQSGVKALPQLPPTDMPKLPDSNQVLATVNGKPLKAGEVEGLVWQIYHRQIEGDFIQYLTIKQAADAAKVTITEDEIQQKLNEFYDQFQHRLRPGQTIEEALEAQSFSGARLYLRVKIQLLLEKVQLLSFEPKNWFKVATLMFPTPGKQPDAMKTEGAKALDAYAKLKAGTSWDSMLSSVTTNPAVLKTGGDIGWKTLDTLPPSARDELSQLKVGEFSKPVETPEGFQIFKIEIRGADAKGADLDELKKRFLTDTAPATIKSIQAKTTVVPAKPQ